MATIDDHSAAKCRRKRPRSRRGASAVEMALVLGVFLTLVLGMFDMGLAVFRYHVVAQTARLGARKAIVHGSMADRLGSWGPGAFSGTAADSHPIANQVRASLFGIDPSQTEVRADWLDGTNEFEARVRVSVSTPYRPIMTFIVGNPEFTIRATSTMLIAH